MSEPRGWYAADKAWSDRKFVTFVWPRMRAEWAYFHHCDLQDTRDAQAFGAMDQDTNCDFIVRCPDSKTCGLAVRVQSDRFAHYKSITIRWRRSSGRKTELAKMRDAIADERLMVSWMIHGYVNEDNIVMIAYGVKIRDVYRHQSLFRSSINKDDGNRFVYVLADDLRQAGVEVLELGFNVQKWLDSVHGGACCAVWIPPPPKPPRDYAVELQTGDRLRHEANAIKLCWMPGDD